MFKKFISSCLKGDVDSVIRYADYVLPYVISDGFNYAISNGHLPVVQWIHETEPNAIHAIQYHQGFGLACENGHIHVAKWILEVNPNVNTTIDILIAVINVSFVDVRTISAVCLSTPFASIGDSSFDSSSLISIAIST
jgi:hypothetical protein